jgi:protein-disulfide isomerase
MLDPSMECAKAAPDSSRARFPRALALALAFVFLQGSTACSDTGAIPSDLDRAHTMAELANIPQRGVFLGDPGAPVTLTIFVDLQCHFCRVFTEKVEPSLVEKYARTGKVRLVFRNLAFLGPGSQKGARMAGAMGLQDHLWQFTTLLFATRQHAGSGELDAGFLRGVAEAIPSVDVDRVVTDSESSAVTAQLVAAQEEANQFGIHAAPMFLLGKTSSPPRVLEVDSLTPEAFALPIDALVQPPG